MRTRIAPTPSGFLHLGNCVNFRLIADLAADAHGTVRLRIDDMDAVRARTEYVDDIFRILAWLGISADEGPRDRADFEANYAMVLRADYYRSQLSVLREAGAQMFACTCSRTILVDGMCVAGCPEAQLPYVVDETALRMRLPVGAVIEMSGALIDLRTAHGDVVIWRRDGLPSYHLVNVVEDRDARITDVIRGRDLLESSALHAYLAPLLGSQVPTYLHHPLLVDAQGQKLSKSVLAANGSSPLALTAENLEFVREQAKGLRSQLR